MPNIPDKKIKRQVFRRIQIPIEFLRNDALPAASRLLIFYGAFGPQSEKASGFIPQWTVAQVAQICGLTTATARRTLAQLRSDGKLVAVGNGSFQSQHVVHQVFPPEDLALLNNKTGNVRYTTSDIMPSRDTSLLPNVPPYALHDIKPWWEIIPALINDIDTDNVWDFWTVKLPSTLNGNDHPLRKIENEELRILVALTALSKGWSKKGVTSGTPMNPVGFTLSTMKKLVGRGDYKLDMDEMEKIKDALDDYRANPQVPSIRDILASKLPPMKIQETPQNSPMEFDYDAILDLGQDSCMDDDDEENDDDI